MIPDISTNRNRYCCEDIKMQVEQLSFDLVLANSEIDNLNEDIISLNNEMSKYMKLISIYKNLNSLVKNRSTPHNNNNNNNNNNRRATFPTLERTVAERDDNENYLVDQRYSGSTRDQNIPTSQIIIESPSAAPPATYNNNRSEEDKSIRISETANNTHVNLFEQEQIPKFKIIVIADEQGLYMQRTLQELLGEQIQVTCFWKPGALLQEILMTERSEINLLSKKDYLIILSGIHEFCPEMFKGLIRNFLYSTRNTNVLFCEVPFNQVLREKILNKDLKKLCSRFYNASYIDMGFSENVPRRKLYAHHVSQILVREIMCIDFHMRYSNNHSGPPKIFRTIATQTNNASETNMRPGHG